MLANDLVQETDLPEYYKEKYESGYGFGYEPGGITIWLVYDAAAKDCLAIKRVPRGNNVNKHIEREVLNRHTLKHPHIVSFREVNLTDEFLEIAVEYTPGRSMAFYLDRFGPLSERHARHFFQQLILAVDFCHKRKTCVRDINLHNLSLSAELDVLKLNNFYLSKNLEASIACSKVGMCDYAAPEVIESDGRTEYDGYASDVWQCGICLFAMVFGYLPFSSFEDTDDTRAARTCDRIINHEFIIPETQLDGDCRDVKISDDVRDLLKRMLTHNAKRRIRIKEILKHPWFLERLPDGALEMNAAVDPLDDKLYSADPSLQRKSVLKRILALAAQPVKASFFHG